MKAGEQVDGKKIEVGDNVIHNVPGRVPGEEVIYTVKARFEDFPPGFECMRPVLLLERKQGRRVCVAYAVVFGPPNDEYALLAGEKFGVYLVGQV